LHGGSIIEQQARLVSVVLLDCVPVRAVQVLVVESVERRWHCIVVDCVKKTKVFIIEAICDHFALLEDKVGLVRLQAIELDQHEDEGEAIEDEYLPKDSCLSSM